MSTEKKVHKVTNQKRIGANNVRMGKFIRLKI